MKSFGNLVLNVENLLSGRPPGNTKIEGGKIRENLFNFSEKFVRRLVNYIGEPGPCKKTLIITTHSDE